MRISRRTRRAGSWRGKSQYDHSEFKAKILKAFALIRKFKVQARANFMCCRSCASAALYNKALSNPAIIGAVYYCTQSEQYLKDDKPGEGSLYISFGVSDSGEERGLTTAYIGKLLIVCLQDAGLHPEWDGSENNAILVSEKIEANQPVNIEECCGMMGSD